MTKNSFIMEVTFNDESHRMITSEDVLSWPTASTPYCFKVQGRSTSTARWHSVWMEAVVRKFFSSFNCYLATPWPTLGHYRGGSLTHLMLITCVLHIWPKGHQEPCNKIESLSLVEHLVGFELGTFQFWSQCLNSLGHSPPLKREVIGNISNFSSASEPSRVFSNSVIGYQKKTMNTNWEEFCKALLNIFGATCQSITYELVVSTVNK